MLSDSDSEDVHQLTINEHFAKAYAYRKEREELQQLRDKYGSDIEEEDEGEEDSEEMESEDEDGEELTPALDAAILKTLARIKKRDPSIYDNTKSVFEEERQKTQDSKLSSWSSKKDKSKPVTIRQQAFDSILNPTSRSPSPQPVTHVQEQKALRDETISAFQYAVKDEDGDDDDDFLVPREKTKDELEREEEEYREFLKREVGDIRQLVTIEPGEQDGVAALGEEEENEKKKNKKKSKKSKEDKDREFLMNYILNRGWIDRSAKRHPTYKEITGKKKDKDKGRAKTESDEDREEDSDASVGELEDEEFEEVNEQFETSYNFRFEEPDAATIKSYPRQVAGLVRREESTRKEARERRKERKEQGMLQKKEEIKRLKALKMKELRSKLERIGKEGGKDFETTKALQELDLDADWDPEAHERQMAEIYSESGLGDEEKPTWDDDIDIGDIVSEEDEDGAESKKKLKKKKKKKDKKEDGEGAVEDGVDVDAMDAENVGYGDDGEEWDGTEEMRKRKLELQYMDSLYEMDFNDMVGDMPTRFKYTPVASQNFGLSPAEILMATDQELNQYMGVKKLAPYRKGAKWDNKRNEKLKELKHSLVERQRERGGFAVGGAGAEREKKRKGKKERLRMKAAQGGGEEGDQEEEKREECAARGKKRRGADDSEPEQEVGGEGIEEGVASKKKRRRHRKHASGGDS
ncbi:Krr1-domain-containing protein [Neolentinus lepideus HHB14362 ss-1]|uniref:Krr1-domain-containing protein n=1 Tax=Neolentinus lepideus HHB14362 ss-1 TaxID=1314782 RepID=A0A165QIZ9_9AGAM|nr:Krr1-domain-containing protein [Neolentinus lepideus HHB14362 ss-1]